VDTKLIVSVTMDRSPGSARDESRRQANNEELREIPAQFEELNRPRPRPVTPPEHHRFLIRVQMLDRTVHSLILLLTMQEVGIIYYIINGH